jgi:hypothetical protein
MKIVKKYLTGLLILVLVLSTGGIGAFAASTLNNSEDVSSSDDSIDFMNLDDLVEFQPNDKFASDIIERPEEERTLSDLISVKL